MSKLNETIEMIVRRGGTGSTILADRRDEMASLYDEVLSCARERRDELLSRLREVGRQSHGRAMDVLKKLVNMCRNMFRER